MSQSPSSPTPPAASVNINNDATGTQITNSPTSAATTTQPQQQEQQPPNQSETFEQALAEVKRLTAIRDELIKEQEAANKEIARIQKRTRLEELKVLVPAELFSRSDYYEAELEKVYNYKNVPDETIRELYQNRMRMIDEGHRSNKGVKQHSASSSSMGFPNIFANFRDVPQFHQASIEQQDKTNSENVKKYYNLMKRITNGSGSTRIE